jgi:dipeptidyl-peptidase-4
VVRVVPKRREVWYTGGGPLDTRLYRVSLDGGKPVEVTREAGTHRVVVAPDGDLFIDVRSSIQAPPNTVLCTREGQIQRTLDNASSDPRLDELALVRPELHTFRNRDGIELHGAYYSPLDPANGQTVPLVVFVYGGPTVQLVANSWNLTTNMTAQFLAAQGNAVWICDNRGSSRRGRDFQAPILRKLGVIEVQDQVDGVQFITREKSGAIDPEAVGITGGSYGGYMTIRAMELAPEVFRAGVAIAPVTFWEGYDTAYTERYMGTPRENPEGYKESSALQAAYRISGKLMIVHGMLDENVHFRHTARFATAMIRAGKAFELLTLPDERHSSRRVEDRRYVLQRTASFFGEALRAK